MKNPDSKAPDIEVKTDEDDQPARRKLLKGGLVVGGLVGAQGARLMPDQWTKPVINAISLPAHAATTEVAAAVPLDLACSVGSYSATGFASPTFTPPAGPVSGGDTVDFVANFNDIFGIPGTINIQDISATLSPLPLPAGEQVTLAIVGTGVTAPPAPAPVTPDAAGVANFPDAAVGFSASPVGNTGEVQLVFSAPSATADCTINFTFTEDDIIPRG